MRFLKHFFVNLLGMVVVASLFILIIRGLVVSFEYLGMVKSFISAGVVWLMIAAGASALQDMDREDRKK